MVNRSGSATVPDGVQVIGGDATDEAFTREASGGASVVYNALNPPYNKWPELFPPLQAGVIEGAASAGAKLVAVENLYMYGLTDGQPLTEDVVSPAPNIRSGLADGNHVQGVTLSLRFLASESLWRTTSPLEASSGAVPE